MRTPGVFDTWDYVRVLNALLCQQAKANKIGLHRPVGNNLLQELISE